MTSVGDTWQTCESMSVNPDRDWAGHLDLGRCVDPCAMPTFLGRPAGKQAVMETEGKLSEKD